MNRRSPGVVPSSDGLGPALLAQAVAGLLLVGAVVAVAVLT